MASPFRPPAAIPCGAASRPNPSGWARVIPPKALLMDEPLSNLDEELSQHLRGELLRLYERLGFTLIYVTHDRAEANDIATNIVCMRHGRIERSVPIGDFDTCQRQ